MGTIFCRQPRLDPRIGMASRGSSRKYATASTDCHLFIDQRLLERIYSAVSRDLYHKTLNLFFSTCDLFIQSHRDALHGTIQDHEHDRRRRLQEDVSVPTIPDRIWRWEDGVRVEESDEPDKVFAPLWQVSPPAASDVNVNLLADDRVSSLYGSMLAMNRTVQSNDFPIDHLFDFLFDPEEKDDKLKPHAFLMDPVYSAFDEEYKVVGFVLAVTVWHNLFDRVR